jgi:hypothetical protein
VAFRLRQLSVDFLTTSGECVMYQSSKAIEIGEDGKLLNCHRLLAWTPPVLLDRVLGPCCQVWRQSGIFISHTELLVSLRANTMPGPRRVQSSSGLGTGCDPGNSLTSNGAPNRFNFGLNLAASN